MVVPEVPARTSTPSFSLGTAAVPAALVPMKLPLMLVPEVPLSVTRMPLVPLPEMTLYWAKEVAVGSADGVVDGAQADVDAVESRWARRRCRCSRCRCSCPRRRSWSAPRPIRTPSLELPEMTLRAAAVVPPTVLSAAELTMSRPLSALGTAAVPAAVGPDEVVRDDVVVRARVADVDAPGLVARDHVVGAGRRDSR